MAIFLIVNQFSSLTAVPALLQCQVLLWIDSKTVAPKSPIALDLETPQYKRYEVNLGLPDMPQIIVRTEKRGDAMIIEVRPKPGTGPEGTLAVMPSTRPHGAEHEMVGRRLAQHPFHGKRKTSSRLPLCS